MSEFIYKKISLLPDYIANQIAAGEVVQRPESIVKELVENSIDAGADSVLVRVKDAGKQMIHIVDNGSGMEKEDLALSVKRHATSKILKPEDLETIVTFGFRGEALASIASVADLEIRTKHRGSELGWKLISNYPGDTIIEPCNTDVGTQIFVKNVFFNIPARRKFLKSNLTEFKYISDTMIRFALSKPDIRLTFYDDDQLIFDAKPANLINRIKAVIGENTAAGLIEIKHRESDIELDGYIGKPFLAKQSKTNQYFFLNGRSIQSKSLSHAVFSAFEHLLEQSKNPFFIINLKMDPKVFDVNVHPQKHEVKFEDERFIYNIINRAVSKALSKSDLFPDVSLASNLSSSPFEKVFIDDNKSDGFLVNKLTGEIIEGNKDTKFNNFTHNVHRESFDQSQNGFNDKFNNNLNNNSNNNFKGSNNLNFSNNKPFSENEFNAYDFIFSHNTTESIEKPKFEFDSELPQEMIWQLHNKYIFIQNTDGVIIIDQHAAHERVLYEKAIKAMNKEFANSQTLLFPINLELNSSEIVIVKQLQDELFNLGYTFELADNKVIIQSVPIDVCGGYESQSFSDIIHQYEEEERILHTNRRDHLAASFACKAAIKTGYKMTTVSIKALLQNLMECNNPYSCPHGRPTIIQIKLSELDKKFIRT